MKTSPNHPKQSIQWGVKLLSLAAVGAMAISLQPDLGAAPPAGKGKPDKPGNGGGGDNGVIYAKARFLGPDSYWADYPDIYPDFDTQAFVADGVQGPESCPWDYWDENDNECAESDGVEKSDVSKGGRWIFSVGWQNGDDPEQDPCKGLRYVNVKDFGVVTPQGESLPDLLEFPDPCLENEPPIEPIEGYQRLLIQIIADDLFKGWARQDIKLAFWTFQGGRNYRLEYKEKLYVIPNPNDPNRVILTTEGNAFGLGEDVDSAKLVRGNGKGEVLGEYPMPLTIEVERSLP